MPNAFLDTNILVYAATGQRDDPDKAEIARQLIAPGDFGLSFQVLQEFYVTCLRVEGTTAEEVDRWIAELVRFDCAAGTPGLFLDAVVMSRRYQITYWDAAIVVAAERLGTQTLYTEDLNSGQRYGSVTAVNPFA